MCLNHLNNHFSLLAFTILFVTRENMSIQKETERIKLNPLYRVRIIASTLVKCYY